MSNRDQLPNWAGRSVGSSDQTPPNPPPGPQQQPGTPSRTRQPLATRQGQDTPPPGQSAQLPSHQQPTAQPPRLVPVAEQQTRNRNPQQPQQLNATPLPSKPKKKGGRTALIVAGVIALFALFGIGGYYIGTLGRGATETNEAAGTTTAPAAPDAETENSSAVDDTAVDDSAVAGDAAEAADNQATADDTVADADVGDEQIAENDTEVVTVPDDGESGDPNGGVAPRRATLRQGVVYLEGTLPSREIADLAVAKAAAVVGEDRVVDEYTIDPTVPFDPSEKAPIYVEEVVLFEFNDAAIAEPFKPLLDLGVTLMLQNPQGTITVTTRTDAVGSEETNLKVATDRARAIRQYMIDGGVPESQINLDPRGEEGTSEDDDDTVAATQRRAEFLVENILE